MRARFLFPVLVIASLYTSAQTLPSVVSGKIIRVDSFPSHYVTARNIDIWLPDGYSADKRYAVLYMHDGQMLYDSSLTWNHLSWDVDNVLSVLMKKKKVRDVIVVGIWNGGLTRHSDYFPQKPFEALPEEAREAIYQAARSNGVSIFGDYKVHSDNYLQFLIRELKPYIDGHFSTLTDRDNTFMAGSSMGGLISIYAICEYPQLIGGVACMSTHWPGIFTMEGNPIPEAFIQYLSSNLPDPKTHRIYFDCGDQTLDALYPPIQKQVDGVMIAHGYTGKSWETHYYPGKDHSEKAWNERLEVPLKFLLKQD